MIYVTNIKRMPKAEYIGRYNPSIERESPLQNPYRLRIGEPKGSTLERYRRYLYDRIDNNDMDIINELKRLAIIAREGDLYLGCWCSPGPCHGDIIRDVLINQFSGDDIMRKRKSDFIVVIAGGREFNTNDHYKLLRDKCDTILTKVSETRNIVVRSGAAKGADTLGERYAKERGYMIDRCPADWDKYGKSAGYRRNKEMSVGANAVICFWDGESRGTKHMIDIAKDAGLQLRVIQYTDYFTDIKEVRGDALSKFQSGDYEALCVLTNGIVKRDGNLVMGKGQALQIQKAYPTVATTLGEHVKENGNVAAPILVEHGTLISFPTKYDYNDNADIELIKESAHQLLQILDDYSIRSVLLPRPGCGLGGLKWSVVRPILEDILDNRVTFITK